MGWTGCPCSDPGSDDAGSDSDDAGSGGDVAGPGWDEAAKLGLTGAELIAPMRTALWAGALFLAIADDGFGARVDDGVGAFVDVYGRWWGEIRTARDGGVGATSGDGDISFPWISGT